MEKFASFLELINYFADKKNYKESNWYKGYKNTHQQVLANPTSDSSLELIWYTRDNSVSSLMQGAPSKLEFERAKPLFSEVTQLIISEPNAGTYKNAQQKLQKAIDEGILSKMYKMLLNRAFAAISPESFTSAVREKNFDLAANYLNKQYSLELKLNGSWSEKNIELKQALSKLLPDNVEPFYVNMAIWHLSEELEKELKKDRRITDNNNTNHSVNEPKNQGYHMNILTPLNQILYGPPGTGKTYNSIVMAVNAAEPNFLPDGESKDELRAAFKARYDQLVAEGRVRFVTFHQSYGYEEFVEGLSAKTEGDQLSYFEKDGVFKSICDDAKLFRVAKAGQISDSFDARWQVFSDGLAEAETGVQIETLSKKTFFTITDVTNNTIRFDKSKGNSVHTLSVKTLKAVYNQEREIKGGLQPYYSALIEYLSHIHVTQAENQIERKHFVLVIDEINRGNISKVFGELITLIEPSKRLGQKESLEVVLPYSGDKFTVPDNLYIIGTMNTADRSLALMDTALRRRFDFVEMMPDYSVLTDDENQPYCINHLEHEIDLVQLLSTLNKRISALYDREHTLGHAFLMPVVDKIKLNDHQSALTELANCFQNKLIPLLAEYFFEDWQKIRLVLADNQKQEGLQLIKETDVDLADLFGDTDEVNVMDDELNDYQLIKADSELWLEPLTYLGIYQPSALGK
ncbi:MAG: 5-methylcytosine-specific restriction protein B [Colwellia sp.]|jgi:5-methylcytosine-specific restriction protein B